jgi:hypothetical protein
MVCMRHFITEPTPGWKEKFGYIPVKFAAPPVVAPPDGVAGFL